MDNPLRDTGNINWAKSTNKNKQDKKHNTKSKNMSNTYPIKIKTGVNPHVLPKGKWDTIKKLPSFKVEKY